MNAPFKRPLPGIMLGADRAFITVLAVVGATYIVLILAMLLADLQFLYPQAAPAMREQGLRSLLRLTWDALWPEAMARALSSPEIQYSIRLSLVTCTVSTVLSVLVGVPLGYLLARTSFRGKAVVDAVLDIPIVLPPLVLGLSLLILFQTWPVLAFERGVQQWGAGVTLACTLAASVLAACWLGAGLWSSFERDERLVGLAYGGALALVVLTALWIYLSWAYINEIFASGVTYQIPGVILAQFAVSCAFAARTMRVTFEQINPRTESVAMTLGCTRAGAFWRVSLPQARRGLLTAASIAWARALGEFGPILVFAGATRMRTEVLPTTVFLELSIGNIEAAVAVSIIMIVAALAVLLLLRTFGLRGNGVL